MSVGNFSSFCTVCTLLFDGCQADDPFFEDPTTPVLIGAVNLYMQSLCYKIELMEQLAITDYKGQEMGEYWGMK